MLSEAICRPWIGEVQYDQEKEIPNKIKPEDEIDGIYAVRSHGIITCIYTYFAQRSRNAACKRINVETYKCVNYANMMSFFNWPLCESYQVSPDSYFCIFSAQMMLIIIHKFHR